VIRYTIAETIERPADEVFPYLADPMLYPQWMPVHDVTIQTPGEIGIGTTARASMKEGSRDSMFAWTVTSFDPGRKVGFRTTEGPMDWEVEFSVQPSGAAAQVTSSGRIRMHGLMRLLEPFMGGEIRKNEAGELRHLKELLEGGV
jgi:uncharacterized protein YndB with AHSA1/START domain